MSLWYSTIKVEYKNICSIKNQRYAPKYMDVRFSLNFQWDNQINDALCHFQYVNFQDID